MLLISARRLVVLYICAKFHDDIILQGIKVIERTRFLYGKLQRGIIPQKCRWSDRCLSLHIVWSCFIFLPSFLQITNGNNSAKNVSGVTVFNLCTSSGHALYLCLVL